jgi:hypothetical protein
MASASRRHLAAIEPGDSGSSGPRSAGRSFTALRLVRGLQLLRPLCEMYSQAPVPLTRGFGYGTRCCLALSSSLAMKEVSIGQRADPLRAQHLILRQ